MYYYSLLHGKPIKNLEGKHIGRVDDMIIETSGNFPKISHVINSYSGKIYIVPWQKVKHIDNEEVILKEKGLDFPCFEQKDEILIRRDILDKQIVDINGHRVVRVNDIQLNMAGKNLYLAGVDVGTPGLLRRLGILEISNKVSKLLNLKTPTNIIPWDHVQTLGSNDSPLRLTTTQGKLTRLHPADLADIIEDLSGIQRTNLFSALDTETAAETLEHMEDDIQLAIFRTLNDEKATDILEEMSADEAVDLLHFLPEEKVKILLNKMEPDEAEDVRELLNYEEDTAGSLMSTEYICATAENTCRDTINLIRKFSNEVELVYYVYVVDSQNQLKGVLSLKDIIVNEPLTQVKDIMNTNLIYVLDEAKIKEVVDLVSKYDLLAVPVLDSQGELKGIITFDDILDLLIPKKYYNKF